MSGGKIIIGNLFDESKINNTSYAKAWYIRCKNDEGIVGTRITQEEFNHIKEQYSQNIPQWDALAERDTTDYDIDLYDEAKEKGGNAIEKYANDKAYEGKSDEEIKKDQNKNKATNISSTVMGVGSVATAGAAAGTVIRTFVRGGAAATNTVKAAQYLWQVGCTMSFAIGLLYECTHPNKNVDAAIKAMDEFLSGTAYNNVDTANTEMLNQANIVTNLGTAAADGQVRVQSELDKKQEEYETIFKVLNVGTIYKLNKIVKTIAKYTTNILGIIGALVTGINGVEGITIPYAVQIVGVIAVVQGVIAAYLLTNKAISTNENISKGDS